MIGAQQILFCVALMESCATVAYFATYIYWRRVRRRRKEGDPGAGAFWLRIMRYGLFGRGLVFWRGQTDSQIVRGSISSSLAFGVIGLMFSAFLWVTYLVISQAE
jgi:hypothetical protein